MSSLDNIGRDWLLGEVQAMPDEIIRYKPSEFNELFRYLPDSVSSIPGPISYDVNPFMREIIDCFDVDSPVREVNLKKGVQITYSTLLESGLLYFMAHIQNVPVMYVTADKELALARVENNIIPMINQSGFADIIRSSDEGNSRKTGKTKDHIQWKGGGYLVPFGAKNADKMRSFSIMVMLKDEIDAWPDTVGKDGDPDALSDARCSGYWERRKIFRGSTPLIRGSSKIDKQYLRGDQRKYMVLCKSCGFPQELRWYHENRENGVIGGMKWEMENGSLILESVRYSCQNCGHDHYEHDKRRLFSEEYGAHWKPTAAAVEPGIRSYHLPAMYSPIGMQPWYKSVAEYIEAYDTEAQKVRDIAKYQVFYNNILAESFELSGQKIRFTSVSAHRRTAYSSGTVPNRYAAQYSGSPILFLTCTVDVHDKNLAVAIIGWTRDARSYIIEYQRIEIKDGDPNCTELSSPVWPRLQEIIEEKKYRSDDSREYGILLTLIDAGYANDTVAKFCSQYDANVYPILGRDRAAKNQTIKEFAEFTTQAGTIGYRILVDHYKDRLAPVLRREWDEVRGAQREYHFNAPVDTTDKQLKELTVESRRKKVDVSTGSETYYWHRPKGADNELWDLLVYGHAAVEIYAWYVCIKVFGLETIKWPEFWDWMEKRV